MSLINLTNEIHPIFRENRFMTHWIHYDSLRPACQLASLFLEHSLPFFHILFDGIPQQIGYRTYPVRGEPTPAPLWQLSPHPPLQLSEKDEAITWAKLESLAHGTIFKAGVCAGALGKTQTNSNFRYRPHWNRTGCGSIITLGHPTLNLLQQAYGQDYNNEACLGIVLTVAQLLVHELCHTVLSARYPDPDHGAYYVGNSRSTEHRRCWEDWFFGGIICLNDERPHTSANNAHQLRLQLADWPSANGKQIYIGAGRDCPQYEFRGPDLAPIEIHWEIPLAFLLPLFQTEEWERFEQDGARPEDRFYRPPRIIGYRFQSAGMGLLQGYHANCNDGVPPGYEIGRPDGARFRLMRRPPLKAVALGSGLSSADQPSAQLWRPT